MTNDQDWRLQVTVDGDLVKLEPLLRRFRAHELVASGGPSELPRNVVVTHHGPLLFAYGATPIVSHWDDALQTWRQIAPPAPVAPVHADRPAVAEAKGAVTQTLVCSAGRLVRQLVEQTTLDRAAKLGLRCTIREHPHLLTTQVAFTVTGPSAVIDELRRDLKTEAWATIRAEANVLNPI
jgi:hypothetical protein